MTIINIEMSVDVSDIETTIKQHGNKSTSYMRLCVYVNNIAI